MKKRTIRNKVRKKARRTKPDAIAKFMAESSKEVAALGGLSLAPQTPLPRQEEFRLTTEDQ